MAAVQILEQAIYLGKIWCNNTYTALPETFAAMALMYFHAARISSRINDAGEIVLLADQDRSQWSRNWIMQGNEYLNKAAFGNSISTYHIEAAIAYEHCTAPTFEERNWPQILRYYDMLSQLHPDAIVMLNRLIVVNKIYGSEFTLKEIADSPYLREWDKHYLFHSLVGEIYTGTSVEKAKRAYEKAIALTKSEAEKKLLTKKIEFILK